MPTKWKHSELGSFSLSTEFESRDWRGTLSLPAFACFKFRRSGPFKGTSRVALVFRAWIDDFTPGTKEASLALRIVKNETELVKKIKRAVSMELCGTGPDSGMYWREEPEPLEECFETLRRAKIETPKIRPDHVDYLIGAPSITIWVHDESPRRAEAILDFSAAFEDEHGLVLLTNGSRILGIGFSDDPSPFET